MKKYGGTSHATTTPAAAKSSAAHTTSTSSSAASRPAVVGSSVASAPSPAKSARRRHLTELKSYITSPLHKLGRLFGVSQSTTDDEEDAPTTHHAAAASHVPALRSSNSSVGSAASAQHRHKTNGIKRRLQRSTDDDEEDEAEEDDDDQSDSSDDASASSASSDDEEVRERKSHETSRRRPPARARETSSRSSSAASSPVAQPANRYAGRLATSTTSALSKLAPVHAAASSAAASDDAPLSPIPRFNGNQWTDRFGNPRLPASAATNKPAKKKPRSEEKGPATTSATPIRTTGPAASSFSAIAAPSRAPASLKSSLASPPVRPLSKVGQLPYSSLSSLPGGSPVVNTVQFRPYTMPGSAAASAMFSAVQAAAAASSAQSSFAAPAAASSSSSSSVSRLFPHPNAMGSHAFHGRSGSSAGTPRKNQQHLNQLQHAAAAHHNHSYHSAAAGTPLVFAHHFPHAQPYVYKHFRGRPPKSAAAKNKAKLSLQSHLSSAASSSSLAGLSSPATHASTAAAAAASSRKAGSTVPAGLPSKVAGKKRDRPYKELVIENLARHRRDAPDSGADWLWQALQHRTPFANVTLTDGTAAPAAGVGATTAASSAAAPAAAASAASSASSSSSLSALSPFARPLPLTDSTIKQYTALQESDDKHVSLYVGLRPLVRYHRLRGLVPPPGPPVKKPNGRPRVDRSEKEPPRSPDDILDTLMQLAAREGARLTEIEEEDEQMEAAEHGSNAPASSSYRAQRPQRSIADPSSTASSLSASSSASSSHASSFYSALSNTALLPTSLSMPLLPEYRKSFGQVPLSLQLFLARFSAHLPPGDVRVALKPKRHHIVMHAAPVGGAEEWMDKTERLLPRPHRKLVRLFYAHVKLPPHSEGGPVAHAPSSAASAAASSSSAPTTLLTAHPLHDLVYHFNTTSFCAHLLHHCYTSDPRLRKFVFPVESTDLPAYYRNVIKCPLSFADLDLRVVCGYYDSPLELLSDLWRTFENTLLWRDGGNTNSKSDVRGEVADLWASIETFLDRYYCSFMSHTPNGCMASPRTLPAVTAAHLAQIKIWMREVSSREIPRLQLVWIKKRERVAPPTDEQVEARSARYTRANAASSSSSSSAAAASASSYGAFLEANRLSDWVEYVAPPDSAASPTPDDHGASDSDSSTASSSRPRKKARVASAAAATSARPTRAHPYSQLDPSSPLARLADPHARFPPDFFSRSRGARHADNLPPALLRKLARRAGKIPYAWDARWSANNRAEQHAHTHIAKSGAQRRERRLISTLSFVFVSDFRFLSAKLH